MSAVRMPTALTVFSQESDLTRFNFVTVYELMDEVMDFGFPQTTDSKILQE